jgi:hypothetical protein
VVSLHIPLEGSTVRIGYHIDVGIRWQGLKCESSSSMVSSNFISETIFSFNPTDIFLSILKVMNAPLEIIPRSVSSRNGWNF